MRIAVAGKGGVGKTTVAAGLCLLMAERGRHPRAVDADPNNCLGYALDIPQELLEDIRPLSEMRELLAKRAGSEPGAGGLFALAPPVADLVAEYEVNWGGISLLVMGIVDEGGTGCMCPENATLRAILRELVDEERDLVVDMVAGLEHLGRGTAQAVDGLVAVTQPTGSSLRTVQRIIGLAQDIGLTRVWALGNNSAGEQDIGMIRDSLSELPLLGVLPHYDGLADEGVFTGPAGESLKRDLDEVLDRLEQYVDGES